jgi:hypothetical protein
MADEEQIVQAKKPLRVTPRRFRRVGRRGFTWGLPRKFPGYFADTSTVVLGAAPKFILKTSNLKDPQYIVKYAQKHGQQETLTEFFINQLGAALGLNIAHSGLILSDDELTFVSRIFIDEDEVLRHGSLIIEDCFKKGTTVDANELERIHPRTEQEFYSIDFVTSVLRNFCGKDFASIFPPFIEMLVFDALIGSMDRHSQNWGVLAKSSGPVTYSFSPIFDTARSLLWSLDEKQIERMAGEENDDPTATRAYEARVLKFVDKAQPCMGPLRNHPKVNRCNHFDFVENLLELYPLETASALKKIGYDLENRAARLLRQFPFRTRFTGKRRRLILKILAIRADRLRKILEKGGNLK